MEYQDGPTEEEFWEQWTDQELIDELPRAIEDVRQATAIAQAEPFESNRRLAAWHEVHCFQNWQRSIEDEMAQRELLFLTVSGE